MPEGKLGALTPRGFFSIPPGELRWQAEDSAWDLAARITGCAPRMVERQRIRAVPNGKSFASTEIDTPLHNDLQLYLGRLADLQILACVRPAERGGESALLDTRPLLRELEASEPGLFSALFEVARRFPFVAGSVDSPTVALFDDRLAFLHSPRLAPGDLVGERIREAVNRRQPVRFAIAAGEILVVDNHRTLHGRAAFEGGDRELIRLLVWLPDPCGRVAPSDWVARASRSPARPSTVELSPAAAQRLDLVLRMIAGTSPGALARATPGGEGELYRMRDVALRAALEALGRCDNDRGSDR